SINLPIHFVQDKITHSYRKVLRGYHTDKYTRKLMRSIWGIIHLSVVDFRIDSPTYLQKYETILTPVGHSVLIPPECLNATQALTDCILFYKWSKPYDINNQITVHYSSFNTNWQFTPILSDR